MYQKDQNSPMNVLLAARQRLESLQRAGVSHIPKAGSRKRGPGSGEKRDGRNDKGEVRIAAPEMVKASPPSPHSAPTSSQAEFPAPCSSREEALAAVAKRVAACTRCPVLVKNRTQTVFGVGNPRATLAFIGEAPGADEDRQGEPFVGRAGQLLTDIITKGMQLRREDVYIMNILRCRPPDNRTPLPDEAANCREYLDAQLAIIQPRYICCLGACAAQNLLGVDTAIGKLRGRLIDFRELKVLCTYHPAYVLRNPPAKKQVWEDIQVLMKEMGLEP
jgi:uracil-DNA glycosylase family 4